MIALILFLVWIAMILIAYRKDFAQAWKEAYPDGFGKNYPSRNCSKCGVRYIEKRDSWIWKLHTKCDKCEDVK